MGMSTGGTDLQSEINVTPMVDIMLVLLIIFMVVTPLLQSGGTVTLPRGTNPDEDPNITKETSVVVAIPNPGEYWVGRDQIKGTDALVARIKQNMSALKPSDPHVVYIKGGVNVPYGDIVNVVNAIRDANIEQIGLVAEKKKDKET